MIKSGFILKGHYTWFWEYLLAETEHVFYNMPNSLDSAFRVSTSGSMNLYRNDDKEEEMKTIKNKEQESVFADA